MDTPHVSFNVTNNTDVVTQPVSGITFIRGKSLRGPFDDPKEVFSNWPAFVKRYGGLISDDDSTLLIQRLFNKNGRIRFSRAGHYTTISNRSTLTAEKAVADGEIGHRVDEDTLLELFELPLKYAGADYNNIIVAITAASNGDPNFFNLSISHVLEPSLNEVYTNLTIVGKPTAANSDYLRRITEGSELVDVIYKDLSAMAPAQLVPEAVTIAYEDGADGGEITDTDIIGDSASNTGFHSFDEYDDSYQIMVVSNPVSDAVHIAGASYADQRQDLQYWLHIDNSISSKTSMISKRNTLNIDSKQVAIFAGGIEVLNPINSQRKEIECITDIAALAVNSENNFGINYSFAGQTRGVITDALAVVNNFGTNGKRSELNELSNHQINMIINRDNQIKLISQFTAQKKENAESFISTVRLVMYIKKALRPVLETYLEEPGDVPSWSRMYYHVKPFFDSLVSSRAIYNWSWDGDQFAKSPQDWKVNSPADVSVGKYKVKLKLEVIVGMQEIEVDMFLERGGTITIQQA